VLDGTASGGVTINDVMTHMFVRTCRTVDRRTGWGPTGAKRIPHVQSARGVYRQTEGRKQWHFFIRLRRSVRAFLSMRSW